MRTLVALLLVPMLALAQAKPTKLYPPDEATRKKITDGIADFEKQTKDIYEPDILVYLKAAQWIVKHDEWHTEKSAQQTLDLLAMGRERLKMYEKGKPFPWLAVRGRPVIRGYRSDVDESYQPYAVRYPDNFDPKKTYRVDVILHGRDDTLTEVKFLHSKEKAKPGAKLDFFELEVYGRGNNAYRWAGETDVFDAMGDFTARTSKERLFEWGVLRGFSMGGAGTWHIGLRHPLKFRALGPGAGFTTTHGYIANFPKQPDYIEKCLRIYDAVGYAENVFNVPVFAYSGEKDKQKLAADLIEAKLKDFKEPHTFKHLVAPGLEHKQPAEWLAKLEVEYQKALEPKKEAEVKRFRIVQYTADGPWTRHWAQIVAFEKPYEEAVIDGIHNDDTFVLNTKNIRAISLVMLKPIGSVSVDGWNSKNRGGNLLIKRNGVWSSEWVGNAAAEWNYFKTMKTIYCSGPIDDAFRRPFEIIIPTAKGWHDSSAKFIEARQTEFTKNWSKYFRGTLAPGTRTVKGITGNIVLFGDPQSNPEIAKLLPKLPIIWNETELIVNGKTYDSKTHIPVLVYPNPGDIPGSIVINSGHTFREADLKGTNANLYPHLGDWAVLKAKPTKDDPAGFEVVAAGLFDADWKFEK
jgi:hypothetical protein